MPHGGLVASCFLQVAATHFQTTLAAQNQPHTIALHLDFLRRTSAGPATFTVRDVKLGRQTSTIHVALSQDGGTLSRPRDEEVVGYITHSNISAEKGLSLTTPFELQPRPAPVDLGALRRSADVCWARRDNLPFAAFRKASQKVTFHFPRVTQVRGIVDEWLCFASGERFTNASLGYVADMFPSPVETIVGDTNPYDFSQEENRVEFERRIQRWYPTLVFNLDIKKRLPEDGVDWLFVRVTSKKIKNGRLDLEIVILDDSGDVVALSHHVNLVLGADRNIAKRREDGGSSKI